ncbi:hypothetical protein JCM3770_003006, partial [Rhodotorula araucariae]
IDRTVFLIRSYSGENTFGVHPSVQ